MLEGKSSQTPPPEIIALPPLKMVLVYAKEEREHKEALQSALRKIELQEQKIKMRSLIKIIEHLEQRK